jgi:hypothetical protein
VGGGWSMQKRAGSKPKLSLHDSQGLNFWKIAHGVIGMLLVQIGNDVRNANPRFLHLVISKGACKIGCAPSAS